MIRSNPNRTSWNNWNQHNNHLTKNSRENLARCISEPKLNRDKLGVSSSLDSLSGPSMPNILRDVLFRKLDTKTNILQSKWVKNWAVLQDNTLYIYADSRETDSVLVSIYWNKFTQYYHCPEARTFETLACLIVTNMPGFRANQLIQVIEILKLFCRILWFCMGNKWRLKIVNENMRFNYPVQDVTFYWPLRVVKNSDSGWLRLD